MGGRGYAPPALLLPGGGPGGGTLDRGRERGYAPLPPPVSGASGGRGWVWVLVSKRHHFVASVERIFSRALYFASSPGDERKYKRCMERILWETGKKG